MRNASIFKRSLGLLGAGTLLVGLSAPAVGQTVLQDFFFDPTGMGDTDADGFLDAGEGTASDRLFGAAGGQGGGPEWQAGVDDETGNGEEHFRTSGFTFDDGSTAVGGGVVVDYDLVVGNPELGGVNFDLEPGILPQAGNPDDFTYDITGGTVTVDSAAGVIGTFTVTGRDGTFTSFNGSPNPSSILGNLLILAEGSVNCGFFFLDDAGSAFHRRDYCEGVVAFADATSSVEITGIGTSNQTTGGAMTNPGPDNGNGAGANGAFIIRSGAIPGQNNQSNFFAVTFVPEPATLGLAGLGLLVLGATTRRKRKLSA